MYSKFAWSYSRYSAYKQCPAKYRYQHILKLPEESSPALERGRKVHDLIASAIRGSIPQDELKDVINAYPELEGKIREYITIFNENGGGVEEQLAVNRKWEKAEWFGDDTWCRGIVDLWLNDYLGKNHALLVDFKTGKFSRWNLKEYEEQLNLFSLILFSNHPRIQRISPQLVFLDAGITYPSKPQIVERGNDKEVIKWQERAMFIETEKEWEPKPNNLCKWCSFSRTKNGPCKVA